MNNLFIEKNQPSYLITQSTSLGQNMNGQVARVFDSIDIDNSFIQMQAISYQFGVPMVNVKFNKRQSSFDKYIEKIKIIFNTFSTTTAVHTKYVGSLDN